jgi:hypothetical protein
MTATCTMSGDLYMSDVWQRNSQLVNANQVAPKQS